jgi:hypothetical protein
MQTVIALMDLKSGGLSVFNVLSKERPVKPYFYKIILSKMPNRSVIDFAIFAKTERNVALIVCFLSHFAVEY